MRKHTAIYNVQIEYNHSWREFLDFFRESQLISLGISKPFRKIWHLALLNKPPYCFFWINSFLSSQRISQGSLLVPRMWMRMTIHIIQILKLVTHRQLLNKTTWVNLCQTRWKSHGSFNHIWTEYQNNCDSQYLQSKGVFTLCQKKSRLIRMSIFSKNLNCFDRVEICFQAVPKSQKLKFIFSSCRLICTPFMSPKSDIPGNIAQISGVRLLLAYLQWRAIQPIWRLGFYCRYLNHFC